MSFDLLFKPSGGVPLTTKGDILTYSTAPVRIGVGSNGQYFTADSAQVTGTKWAGLASVAPDLGFTAITANLTLDSTNDMVSVSGSGGTFTVTLPTAVGISGKVFYIQRSDSTPSKLVKIATTSAQTIDGVANKFVATQNEEISIISDNANWHVLNHKTQSPWVAESGLTFSAAFGVVGTLAIYSRRNGDQFEVLGKATPGTVTGGTASVALPTGLVIDSAKMSANHCTFVGQMTGTNTAASNINTTNKLSYVIYDGSDTANLYFAQNTNSSATTKAVGTSVLIASDIFSFFFSVPIANWSS